MFTDIKRSPLVNQVIEQLSAQIQRGEWPVGYKLPPENALAAALKVGRSTIREAVRALAHSGLLEVRQGSGTFVKASQIVPKLPDSLNEEGLQARLRRAKVLEIYEVRRAIELEAARLAAVRRDEDDLARIENALAMRQTARASASSEEFVKADLEFHLAVADAAHNAVLSELFAAFAEALHEALVLLSGDQAFQLDTSEEHSRLAHAIRDQNVAEAEAATLNHLDATVAILKQLSTPETNRDNL
jgi:DNA-binding FadR family transcriptional regulator